MPKPLTGNTLTLGEGDIHTIIGAEVFGTPPEQVTNDLRRSAKAINFGLIYGMSAFGLAQQLRGNNTCPNPSPETPSPSPRV